jgi:hypothetical protein
VEEDQQRVTVKEKELEECRGRKFDRNIKRQKQHIELSTKVDRDYY